jgi:polyisoprenoid-binding protein YceI
VNRTIFIILFVLTTGAFSTEYQVNKERENQVIFNSNAPVEKIQGNTGNIDGYVSWDDQKPLDKSEMYFEVDMNTLDTGNSIRDRHMRDNFLETEKFQYAFFRGTIEAIDALDTDLSCQVVVNGMMNIHGVEKPYKINGTVTRENKELVVTCYFDIALPEHNIKIPQFMFMKLAPVLQIEVNFYLLKQE